MTREIDYRDFIDKSGRCILPDGIREIPDEAFSSCSGLTNITIHEGVTYMGDDVF